MSLLVLGLSHRSAPVGLLERVVLSTVSAGKLARDLVGGEHIAEAVVLSTCNRVEVYADAAKFHGGVTEVIDLLSRHTGVDVDELSAHLYVHYENRAVQHAFAVACGLDSMVVGETQVLGQVREALRAAQDHGTAGRLLNELLQQALRVGKRAHTETGIDSTGPSLVSVGLDLAAGALGGLAGRRALVVGAGSMSSLAARTLRRLDVGDLAVANRTFTSGQRLAAAVSGHAVALTALTHALAEADVVVSCTGSIGSVVTRPAVEAARTTRAARAGTGAAAPQFFLDLALPRDIEAEVALLDGVALVDLAHLAVVLDGDERAGDVEAVRRIVADEVATFLAWQHAVSVAPTVVALREMAAHVVDAELTRLVGRCPELDNRSRDEVAQTVRRGVDKLLHAPTVRVKQLADPPGGQTYAAALRELFDLDPRRVDALITLDPAVDVDPDLDPDGHPDFDRPAGGAA